MIAGLKVIGTHISTDDVVGVFFSLIDAVYWLVGFLFLIAALFGSVFIDWGADDGDFDTERFDLFYFAVCDKLIVFQFIRGFEFGVNYFNFWACIDVNLLFFLR